MIHLYVDKPQASIKAVSTIYIDIPRRFTIIITLDTLAQEGDPDTMVYEGEGALFIESIIDEKPGRSATSLDIRFQESCFQTGSDVSATPDNIMKAMGWCFKNQDTKF